MHANAFDRYQTRSSLIHRLDPRLKVLATVGFILSNGLLPDGAWLGFGLAWGVALLVSLLARLGVGYAFKRSFVALPFALAALTVLFALPGAPLASFQLGPWLLTITMPGLLRFVSIVVRSWLSLQMAILLVAVTSFPDLLHALRHLYVPDVLVSIISFMYRYLFVLTDETFRLLRARQARAASAPGQKSGGRLVWRAKVAGEMAGQLFLRAYERSDRVYNAMLARGYTGTLLTLNPHVMRRVDWLCAAAALATLALIQLAARLFA
jgi:cobalt/nickel transport system permease protein